MSLGGPAFSAYQSSTQSVPNATWTKVQLNVKEFDTNNCFDNTTNYRFTPTVAGYYYVLGTTNYTAITSTSNWSTIQIGKNGTLVKYGTNQLGTPNGAQCLVTALIYLNGTTDYIELYTYQSSGASSTLQNASNNTYFSAAMVRSA